MSGLEGLTTTSGINTKRGDHSYLFEYKSQLSTDEMRLGEIKAVVPVQISSAEGWIIGVRETSFQLSALSVLFFWGFLQ